MKKSRLAKANEALFNSFVKKYQKPKKKRLLTEKEAQAIVNYERDLEYVFEAIKN